MKLLDRKVTQVLHLFIVYPLTALGALIVFGSLWAFLDAKDALPPELICTPGYPCHERFED